MTAHPITKATSLEKLTFLEPLAEEICQTVKSFLKKDLPLLFPESAKILFNKRDRLAMKASELAEGFKALLTAPNAAPLMDLIAQCWTERNHSLYKWMEIQLMEYVEDYTKLEELDPESSKKILDNSRILFKPHDLLIFCVLNSVVLDNQVLTDFFEEILSQKK
jgi:hypothetical protein